MRGTFIDRDSAPHLQSKSINERGGGLWRDWNRDIHAIHPLIWPCKNGAARSDSEVQLKWILTWIVSSVHALVWSFFFGRRTVVCTALACIQYRHLQLRFCPECIAAGGYLSRQLRRRQRPCSFGCSRRVKGLSALVTSSSFAACGDVLTCYATKFEETGDKKLKMSP